MRARACVRACVRVRCVCVCVIVAFFFLHPPCPRKRHTWLLWCSLMRWTPKRGKSGCFRLFFHEEWIAWWPLLDLAGEHGWASRSIRTFDLQGVRLSLVSALSLPRCIIYPPPTNPARAWFKALAASTLSLKLHLVHLRGHGSVDSSLLN